jgi:predicted metal-dependent enzyme (double-stranded beta helix superfamily)
MAQDWTVTAVGECLPCPTPREWDLLETPYYFHRFLTAVEDSLKQARAEDQCDCLPSLRKLVRKLVLNSYWLQTQRPDPTDDSDFLNLYDEIGFPLTVQIEALMPGTSTTIHNHGTWGIVAVLQGQAKNRFWQRWSQTGPGGPSPEPEFPDKISVVQAQVLEKGAVISFVPAAIHSVEALGAEPLVTFNLYGETDRKQRFEFDAISHSARNY